MGVLQKQTLNVVEAIAARTGRSIDLLYASFLHRLGVTGPFFVRGWGDLGVVDFEEDARWLKQWPPPNFADLKIQWRKVRQGIIRNGVPCELLEGTFRTPCIGRIHDALPPESRTGRVQLLLPVSEELRQACVLHLAGTGDHLFRRRMNLGAPLVSEGIACMALESPFYGRRRPAGQSGSKLRRVSDLLTLGRATIEESMCLLNWAADQGFERLGISGFSMGGVHASMVAALYPAPLACTPLLSPRSAAVAFCDGALQCATAWEPLTARADEKEKDVEATVLAAAQPNAITAAAARVLKLRGASSTAAPFTSDARQGDPASAAASSGPMIPAQNDTDQWPSRQQGTPSCSTATAPAPSPADSASHSGSTSRTIFPSRAGLAEARDTLRAELREHEAMAAGTSELAESPGSPSQGKDSEPRRDSEAGSGGSRGNGIDAAERKLAEAWAMARWGLRGGASRGSGDPRTGSGAAGVGPKDRYREARELLQQVLETYTDVTRFPRPLRPDAAVLVAATDDAYVSATSVLEQAEHWGGAEVRWVSGGHVSGFLLHQPTFRAAIRDSIERLKEPAEQRQGIPSPGAQASDEQQRKAESDVAGDFALC